MSFLERFSGFKQAKRVAPTVALIGVVLLGVWMGEASGGYFVGDWALVAFILATLTIVLSVAGLPGSLGSSWVAVGLFTCYAAWTCASFLWSPNQGDAWVGVGQTLLYLLAFVLAVALITAGASRRWVLAASVIGPAVVAAFTLSALVEDFGTFFADGRLIGTVGYYNGEAAFLLAPFWVAIYLAGSRLSNPFLRGLLLAGATLCVEVASLTQSRGALVAMVVSLPIFFAFSGQRVRGLLALAPVAVALAISFPGLNEVYLAFLNGGTPDAVLGQAVPAVWLTAALSGAYGLLWGIIDQWWSPPAGVTRVFGAAVLVVLAVVFVVGTTAAYERVGNPVSWAGDRWEAFKTNDTTGQEQSRYLSASGSGRYTLWQVAWEDFTAHPLLGVGTHNYEPTYYQLREQPIGYVRQPHILPLEILGERGIVGGALFFGFLGVCVAAGLWRRFKHSNAEGKALAGATIAAVAYWFVHSSAEWFWQLPAVTLPAMVYLAVLVTPLERPEAAPLEWLPRLAVAAGAVLVATIVFPLYAADRYLAHGRASENPWIALEAVERAQGFNPVDPRLHQQEAELAMSIGNWPRVKEAYGEAIRLNPRHYAPYTLLARFHEQRGEPAEALRYYREALALNPLDPELLDSVERLETQADSGS